MPTYSSPQSVLVRERPTQGSAAGGGDLDRNKVVLERSANGRLWIFPGFGAQRPRMGRNLRGLEPLVAMANAAGAADTVSVDRMCNDDDPGWSIEDVVPSLLSVALAPRWSRRRQSRLRMRCGLPRSGVGIGHPPFAARGVRVAPHHRPDWGRTTGLYKAAGHIASLPGYSATQAPPDYICAAPEEWDCLTHDSHYGRSVFILSEIQSR